MKFIVMLVFWHRETGLFDILQFDGRLDYTIILIIRLYYYVVIFFLDGYVSVGLIYLLVLMEWYILPNICELMKLILLHF